MESLLRLKRPATICAILIWFAAVFLTGCQTPQERSQSLASEASAFNAQRNYQQCIDLAQKATVVDPQNATAWYWLGSAYFNLNQNDDAIGPLKRAIELNIGGNQYYDVNAILGSIYRQKNEAATALPYLKEAVKSSGGANLSFYYNELGLVYEQLGQLQIAVADFMAAESFKSTDPAISINLAQAEGQIGNPRLEDLISPLGIPLPFAAIVEFEHWQLPVLIAAKNRDLPALLRERSAAELQDLATKLEQAILDYTDKSATTKDHAEQDTQNVRQPGDNGTYTLQISDTHVYTTEELDQLLGGLTHPTTQGQVDQEREVARLYEEKVEILKSVLAAVKVELANRSK